MLRIVPFKINPAGIKSVKHFNPGSCAIFG